MQKTQEMQVQSLDQEDPLEKEMATHSSILPWEIPWTREPGRSQSMGSQRIGHDLATKQQPEPGRRWTWGNPSGRAAEWRGEMGRKGLQWQEVSAALFRQEGKTWWSGKGSQQALTASLRKAEGSWGLHEVGRDLPSTHGLMFLNWQTKEMKCSLSMTRNW